GSLVRGSTAVRPRRARRLGGGRLRRAFAGRGPVAADQQPGALAPAAARSLDADRRGRGRVPRRLPAPMAAHADRDAGHLRRDGAGLRVSNLVRAEQREPVRRDGDRVRRVHDHLAVLVALGADARAVQLISLLISICQWAARSCTLAERSRSSANTNSCFLSKWNSRFFSTSISTFELVPTYSISRLPSVMLSCLTRCIGGLNLPR